MLVAMIAIAMSSCSRSNIYSHYESVSAEGWSCSDTVRFELGPVLQGKVFGQKVNLRTTSAYPYTALSMIVHRQVLPKGEEHQDTISIVLCNDKGVPTGTGITHRQNDIVLSPIKIETDEKLAVTIWHNMKQTCLPGISEIGLSMR